MICASCGHAPATEERCPQCGEPPGLAERYRILEQIAQGTSTTTYLAERIQDGAQVALKKLLVSKIRTAKALELFEREARVLQELSHPGIPACHGLIVIQGSRSTAFYLVQDFVSGPTLAKLYGERRATEEEVVPIVIEVLQTLTYLHRLSPPVIHRDIKPANIIQREADGRLVLIDFGAVRSALHFSGDTITGTTGFMAPEQLVGEAYRATDIYALGATAVTLLTHVDPAMLMGPGRRLDVARLELRLPGFAEVLQGMVEPEVEDRSDDAALLAAQLHQVLSGRKATNVSLPPALHEAQRLSLEPDAMPVEALAVPRPAPRAFARTYLPRERALGIAAGALMVLSTGLMLVLVKLSPSLLAPTMGVLGVVSGLCAVLAMARYSSIRFVYTHGAVVSGSVTHVDHWRTRLTRRDRWTYRYTFEIGEALYRGTHVSPTRLRFDRGDRVTVLHDRRRPSRNVLWFSARGSA